MPLSTGGKKITMRALFGRSSTLPNGRTTSRWYSGTTLRVMKTRMTTITAAIMNPVGIGMGASLFDLRARRDVVHCREQSRHLFLAGGQDHPLRLDAHELGRLHVPPITTRLPTRASGMYFVPTPATTWRRSVPLSKCSVRSVVDLC